MAEGTQPGAQFWSLPAGTQIILVDTEEKLVKARDEVVQAAVLGLDAEWEPGSRKPQATLVQLAAWSGEDSLRVYLLDAIALAFKCVRGLVKQIITDQRVLLIGFGLRTDLWSLQLDPARLSLGRALDLQHAQRWLETAAPAALPSVSSEGLSAMVAAYMAAPLDKAMQCSDWAARPLTPEQVRYAAADAACLLCLLSEMIDRVPDIDRREHATTDAGPGDRRGLRRPDPETLRRVAASWPGPAWEAAARPKRAAQRRREARKGSERCVAALPVPIPQSWPPRFVCDVMLQGLARQLRLIGFDAEAMPTVGSAQRPSLVRRMVQLSEDEGRVLLTRDVALAQARFTDDLYWVRANTRTTQVEEIAATFKLNVNKDSLLSRCCKCNGEFIPRPLSAAELKATSGVPEGVKLSRTEFWVCSRCESVFWQGSQYLLAMRRLTKMTERLGISAE